MAILFAGIFTCIIPVLAVLDAGKDGALAWLLDAVTTRDGSPHDVAYFWLTGGLSAFLDNAPTYLVFFELAGGNAQELMGPLASTLKAISMGAVYMGALTYIGNAPNFMVYAIAVERGVKMPSFFGYMVWSARDPAAGLRAAHFPFRRIDRSARPGRFLRADFAAAGFERAAAGSIATASTSSSAPARASFEIDSVVLAGLFSFGR